MTQIDDVMNAFLYCDLAFIVLGLGTAAALTCRLLLLPTGTAVELVCAGAVEP
jgi:hypothetical protein